MSFVIFVTRIHHRALASDKMNAVDIREVKSRKVGGDKYVNKK